MWVTIRGSDEDDVVIIKYMKLGVYFRVSRAKLGMKKIGNRNMKVSSLERTTGLVVHVERK